MSLSLAIKSELVKYRRTSVWYLAVLTGVIASVYFYLFAFQPHKIEDLKQDPWNAYFTAEGGMALNIMILPLFLIMTCTLLAQVEYRNNTWKQVYVSPQSLLNVFLSKFFLVQILLLGVFFLTVLLSMASLLCIHYFRMDINLDDHTLDWNRFLIFYGRIYLTVLAISAFQFWLGLRFRNFIVPVVVGLCLWLAGMLMLEEYPWVHDDKFPYVYPMRNFFPRRSTDRTVILWGSVIYTFSFLLFGFRDFNRRSSRA